MLIVVAALVAAVLKAFVVQAYYIPSASMLPGLHVNDRVVVSRLAYDLHSVHRGDVVVFSAPPGIEAAPAHRSLVIRLVRDLGAAIGVAQDRTVLIKRVVALPGDTVTGRNGHVFVNGLVLDEPYLVSGTLTSDFGPFRVDSHHVWVMGDNRGDSEDSRIFGAIPESHILGRATWRVWPLTRLGFL
ncbi:MAG: signal peptidase I [Actinomycetota bacterium]|nr:signal peptidase I [Actinomycetota bacterium]